MKRIVAIALFVATILIPAGSALAQDQLVGATVPFSFTVNGTTLPAGTYKIGSDVGRANVLSIRDRQSNVNIFAMGQMDSGKPGAGKLVFHRYGDNYFLSGICYPNSSTRIQLPVSKLEKRTRAHSLEASLNVDNNVLIALN
jgi:hypothetical protein